MKQFFGISIVLVFLSVHLSAQYAPAAGEDGSTAIHKDSAVIQAWVTKCEVHRGYIDIEDTTKEDNDTNRASFGADTNVLGYPKDNVSVVSLGDGGFATVSFNGVLFNGTGPDFAVFENGFKKDSNSYFLELAFVEVSSDSIHFVRFPSVSLTQTSTQVEGFDGIDPQKIHNLAGKYVSDYGTPFDLNDLKDSANVDINAIRFIRIVDVVGDINEPYATYDSQGHKINEPWSTAFQSGGFDLNAVGAIHIRLSQVNHVSASGNCRVYPNPVSLNGILHFENLPNDASLEVYAITGKKCFETTHLPTALTVNHLLTTKGLYILKITGTNFCKVQRIIVK